MSDPGQIRVAAIVNSFNRKELLAESLASLRDHALGKIGEPAAVVVFDAGSKDGSREFAENFDGRGIPILVIGPNAEDNSFSAGLDAACEHAIRTFPALELLFLFETDNWIASEKPLREAMELLRGRPELAGVGFTVRKHAGERAGYGCRFPTRFEFALGPQLTHRLKMGGENDSPWQRAGAIEWRTCDVVYTSPLLVRKEAWARSGGLDAIEFPFSDCDLDWAWRLRKLGLELAVIRSDEVVHDNRETKSKWSETRALHLHRARLRLLKRHRPGGLPLEPFLLLRHAGELGAALAAGFLTGNWAAAIRKRWKLLTGVFGGYEF
jgi:GT2 family glycosyltransferase